MRDDEVVEVLEQVDFDDDEIDEIPYETQHFIDDDDDDQRLPVEIDTNEL